MDGSQPRSAMEGFMASTDIRRIGLLAVGLVASVGAVGYGQLRSIPAEVTPLLESDQVPQGSEVRAALTVRLPDGFHVQSDAPRDPSLIRTALTVQPPEGISVAEIVYPPSTDLKQLGVEELLAVFEQEFAIGVRLAVGRDVPEGPVDIPVRLRYQACNDKICFAPATARVSLALRVVAPGTPVTAQHGDVLDTLAFGSGRAPTDLAEAPDPPVVAPAAGDGGGDGDRAARRIHVARHRPAGIWASEASSRSSGTRRPASRSTGLFEGRGPLAILLIVFLGGLALNLTPCVLPMIPINLAIIGAGAQAGSRRRGFLLGLDLRRRDGLGLRRARAHRHADGGHVRHHQRVAVVQPRASPCCSWCWRLAMFDVFEIDFSRFDPARSARQRPRHVHAGVHDGRGGGPAGRRVRGAGRHPGRAVLEQPLRDRHDRGARAAVLPRHRHGHAVADRRRRHRVAAEARARGWCA